MSGLEAEERAAPVAPTTIATYNAASNASPYKIPIPSGYASGNAIVVIVMTNSTTGSTIPIASIADSNGHLFSKIAQQGFDTNSKGRIEVWALSSGFALPANGTINITMPNGSAISAHVMSIPGPVSFTTLAQNNGANSIPSLVTGNIPNPSSLILAAEGNWAALTWAAPFTMQGGSPVSGNSNGFQHTGYDVVSTGASVTAQMSATAVAWGMILLMIAASPLTITSTIMTPAVVGQYFSSVQAATGGFPPYTWSATGLPPGLTISNSGTIAGFPAVNGTFNPVLTCTDNQGNTTTYTQSVTVSYLYVPVPPENDVAVTIYDKNLNAIGNVAYATVNAQLYYNAVGTWSVLAPYSDSLWNMAMSGDFIVLINWRGVITFGGKCEQPTYMTSIPGSTGASAAGTSMAGPFIMLSGGDFLQVVANRIAYPDPTKAWSGQLANDADTVVNLPLESAIKYYVNRNLSPQPITLHGGTVCPAAIPARQHPLLTVAPDQGRGPAVNYAVKFGSGVDLNMMDIIRGLIAQNNTSNVTSGTPMGVKITMNSSQQLVFDVYIPRNLTATAWFSQSLGNLTSVLFSLTDPTCTDALVQGSGTSFISAEAPGTTPWNKAEQYINDSTETSTNNLNLEAQNALLSGTWGPNITTTVTDTPYLTFGRDYGLGDIVSVEVHPMNSNIAGTNTVYTDIVSGVTLTADPSQVPILNASPTIGLSSQSTTTDPIIQKQLMARVRALEKKIGRT